MSYMRQENAGNTEPLGKPRWITVHWSAGGYETTFDHYHFNVTGSGNVVQTLSTKSLGSHVWQRNSNNLGVGFCAMAPGCPVKPNQIDAMGRLIAELMGVFGLPIEAVVDHVYWANKDKYGPGSGDPDTRIDVTGTKEGKALWSSLITYIKLYREQLGFGKIKNTLVGVIN